MWDFHWMESIQLGLLFKKPTLITSTKKPSVIGPEKNWDQINAWKWDIWEIFASQTYDLWEVLPIFDNKKKDRWLETREVPDSWRLETSHQEIKKLWLPTEPNFSMAVAQKLCLEI